MSQQEKSPLWIQSPEETSRNYHMAVLILQLIFFFSLIIPPSDLSLRFGDNKLLPQNVDYLTDDSPDTCAIFSFNKETPHIRDTIFRVELTEDNTDMINVTLIGSNLQCGHNLYVVPITEPEKASWKGIWIACSFVETSIDEKGEKCLHQCHCSGRCEEIQIMKRPREGDDPSWNLCHIMIINAFEEDTTKTISVTKDGWTIILKRMDGSVDFNREWEDYKNSFGSSDGEFWAGNEQIHRLTNDGRVYSLRVELKTDDGKQYYAEYGKFSIASEDNRYTLHVSNYVTTSTVGREREKLSGSFGGNYDGVDHVIGNGSNNVINGVNRG
ncbi:hypothetical protein LSH36_1849g00001 [Paralvinella palmiformis]|uniref:Fibrinogen C-terminal domain-containing protein n=1 Tax=Paralvinella palmiformis TaxID=53620 RepID=A0AAD9IQX1_9ANNE|nr:hypothetical protein LSH36_1849g00001 [Paralvinella palmiformis]